MINAFNINSRTILFLAAITICLVITLISQLDESSRGFVHQIHIHSPFRDPIFSDSDELPRPASDIISESPPIPGEEATAPESTSEDLVERHWIDDLIETGTNELDVLLKKRTTGVKEAAAAYRRRRGRQPPPRFDEWVKYAEENEGLMVEDMFDQIYRDLDPFWSMPAEEIRHASRAWKCFISVRDGNTTSHTDIPRAWMELWQDMISQIAHLLPDLDIAINEMDESRVMASWESVDSALEISKTRWINFPNETDRQVTEYPLRYSNTFQPDLFPDHGFQTVDYLWSIAQQACAPSSPGRQAQWDDIDYTTPAKFPVGAPDGSYHGFVSNWTHAKDPCAHPHLRELHGSFIEPLSMSTTAKLIPMFGGSKLPMNNDILLPAAMYWTDDVFYKGTEKRVPWSKKNTSVIWRGAATGGRNKADTWHRFQRHRFVSMMNGSQVHAAELLAAAEHHPDLDIDVADAERKTALNFPLLSKDVYDLSSEIDGRLGSWIKSWADAKFGHLLCFPGEDRGPNCSYTDPFYETTKHTSTEEQYQNKYLPDIDGNSFSGRYRGFLRSYSLPIKATIYSEWHDSRLVPWKHFVPMDNTFVDFFGIMEYFLGYEPAADGVDLELRRAYGLDSGELPETNISRPSPDTGMTETDSELDAYKLKARKVRRQQIEVEAGPAQPDFLPTPEKEEENQRMKQYTQSKTKSRAKRRASHDAAARKIAEEGHDWAERVLRKEDMLIYTYRLLLEYARIAADSRERMGWVGDGIVFGFNDQDDYV